ncbi:hypothetical protein [Haladaptatus sp. NG-SE-30]
MATEREEYQGREIVTTDDDTPKLQVDDRQVEVTYIEDKGVYATKHFPYNTFESKKELGKAVVDNWSRIKPGLDEEDEQ